MPYTFQNEEKLLKDIRKGDNLAFDYIFREYYDQLVYYTITLTGNLSEAEDIAQSVLTNFWEKKESHFIHSSLRSFLFSCCHNLFIDQHRKHKKRMGLADKLYFEAMNNSPSEDSWKEDQIKKLNLAIEKLPEKSKEIFILNKKRGFHQKEIAKRLDISIKTVEYHMAKSLKFLKDYLKP